jgi:hypothetical protein
MAIDCRYLIAIKAKKRRKEGAPTMVDHVGWNITGPKSTAR